jgi:hypothetical protein
MFLRWSWIWSYFFRSKRSVLTIKPFTSFDKLGIEFSLTAYENPGDMLWLTFQNWQSHDLFLRRFHAVLGHHLGSNSRYARLYVQPPPGLYRATEVEIKPAAWKGHDEASLLQGTKLHGNSSVQDDPERVDGICVTNVHSYRIIEERNDQAKALWLDEQSSEPSDLSGI